MSDFRRRHLLAVLAGVSVLGMGAGGALAAPSKRQKSVKKPTPTVPMARPKLVFLDPGHGGRDPGALGGRGTQEKSVVLAIARDLQRELLAGNRYRVLLSRNTDSYVALRERVARAQAAKADLFLSLHADAHSDNDVRGASVYTLSEEATDREAAALAARENRAGMVVSGMRLSDQPDNVAQTLVAMSQRGTVNDSRRLADTVVATFARNGVRLLPRTHRQAGFAVLTSPDIPAALVELGYLSNSQDEKLLTVRQHQLALARALRASVDAYFGATRKA
ncbi:N-acetylmuramoyl-L-alanine amidase [Reyranella sp. MMS21-HV4-11]|jgi:N-acetylmuramoyl-L-alanine amidase|uniref:N-acetylmuramoyl-L-alanine amidase n=1 Tax=Reyranella humidisoli TaxID=2849149 RepID=A0ABS6IU28_9HYPH|nr:N-acetylmuramoyl-L-alanine amidase [Reyranella sp. MMS21-HV4-11]MBU8876705.1 N-acetylmuramoyl-L-alanine amidase [Reyranella sp. MMS21-HV4-11]